MERDYADRYERLYREHWWWRARESFVFDAIRRLPLPNNPHILDIGCGNGFFFSKLVTLGGSVDGIEFDGELVSDSMLQTHSIHIGPFDRTFKTDKRYDLILMLDVLEHLESDFEALVYVNELLKPNGKLVLTVPALTALWTRHDDLNHHYRRYSLRSIQEVAKRAGFRIAFARYFFHSLALLKLAVRTKEAFIGAKSSPPEVPASWMNHTMVRFFLMEQSLCTFFPWLPGSSLMVVCQLDQKVQK